VLYFFLLRGSEGITGVGTLLTIIVGRKRTRDHFHSRSSRLIRSGLAKDPLVEASRRILRSRTVHQGLQCYQQPDYTCPPTRQFQSWRQARNTGKRGTNIESYLNPGSTKIIETGISVSFKVHFRYLYGLFGISGAGEQKERKSPLTYSPPPGESSRSRNLKRGGGIPSPDVYAAGSTRKGRLGAFAAISGSRVSRSRK